MPQSIGGPFANYMAAAAAAASNRKHFDGPGNPMVSSPVAASLAAAAARFPNYLGSPAGLMQAASPYMPPAYRHPLFPNFPGLGSPYHPASFHSLLAGLSQHRPKLGDFPQDYQSLLAAVSSQQNSVEPSKSSPSPASPTGQAAAAANGSTPPPAKKEPSEDEDRKAESIAQLRNKAREHEQALAEADAKNESEN